jgi:cell wall-associated NlpC family hydrolase
MKAFSRQSRHFGRVGLHLVLVLLFVSCKRVERGTPQLVLDTIEQTRERYCPDRRLAVFDITAEVRGANLRLAGEVSSNASRQALVKAVKSVARDYKVEEEIIVLPESRLGAERYGIINVSVANLRGTPRHGAELTNQLLLGSTFVLLKQKEKWFYGQAEDGYLGWLPGGSFVRVDSSALAGWQRSNIIRYTELAGRVRSVAEDNGLPVSEIVLGGILRRLPDDKKTKTGWTQVTMPDGRAGFLPGHSLSSGAPSSAAVGAGARVIATAQKLLGIPYLWGGASVHGFDCSGFTQTVFAQNGVALLRDASQQVRGGEAVEIDRAFANLHVGDLLFFGESAERITHVAISLSGARFIHASDFVRISSLNPNDADYEEYRARTLQSARRYLKEPAPISGRGKF